MTNDREIAMLDRFAQSYSFRRHETMRAVERSVCGCSFGASSWTDRAQADAIIAELGFGPGQRVLEIGAGSGWPGLYFAQVTGCDVLLLDKPAEGLEMAREQARELGISACVETLAADAATADLPDGSFPFITHSDVLCCLPEKRAVLDNCRRIVARDGRMLFTVIYHAEELSPADFARADTYSPEFAATDTSYPDLLHQAGWRIERSEDVTPALEQQFAAQIAAERRAEDELVALLGRDAWEERLAGFIGKHAAIRDRLVRRALFRVAPVAI